MYILCIYYIYTMYIMYVMYVVYVIIVFRRKKTWRPLEFPICPCVPMERWLHRWISSCPSRSELLVSNSKPKQSSNVGRKGRTAEIGKYQKPPSQPSAGPKLISGRQVRQHRRPITQILSYPAMFSTVAFDSPHPDHYISSDPDTIQAPVIQIENWDGSHGDGDDDDDEIASSEFTPNFASHPSRFG